MAENRDPKSWILDSDFSETGCLKPKEDPRSLDSGFSKLEWLKPKEDPKLDSGFSETGWLKPKEESKSCQAETEGRPKKLDSVFSETGWLKPKSWIPDLIYHKIYCSRVITEDARARS
jgi:hypothetical protein